MSGSTLIVAGKALLLKRTRLAGIKSTRAFTPPDTAEPMTATPLATR